MFSFIFIYFFRNDGDKIKELSIVSLFIQNEKDANLFVNSPETYEFLLDRLAKKRFSHPWDKVVILGVLANMAESSDKIVAELRHRNIIKLLTEIICSPSSFGDPGDHHEAIRCMWQILIASGDDYKKSIESDKTLIESILRFHLLSLFHKLNWHYIDSSI